MGKNNKNNSLTSCNCTCEKVNDVKIDVKAFQSAPKKLCSIQFMHPGEEHKAVTCPKTGGLWTPWNSGKHKRKAIVTDGQYFDNGQVHNDRLIFWGEWEPDSLATKIIPSPQDKEAAHYLHTPLLNINTQGNPVSLPSQQIPQNTDPLVLGDNFYYSLCQQTRRYNRNGVKIIKPTQLYSLEKGSIIMFGSRLNKNGNFAFMLDTVFVVAESKEYNSASATSDLSGFISNKDYYPILRLNSSQPGNCFRCYKGATLSNTINGMFSFSPCYIAGMQGLNLSEIKRPLLTQNQLSGLGVKASEILNEKMTQGFKSSPLNLTQAKNLWNRLVKIVTNQGFKLGVQFKY